LLARPTAALVQMGSRPQDQAALRTMLQYARGAMQDSISTVLLASLVQRDVRHARIPLYAMGATQGTFSQMGNARRAQPDAQHARIPQYASVAVRATFFQMIHARLV
jgi:hypothetical protein